MRDRTHDERFYQEDPSDFTIRKIAATTPVAAKPYQCIICGNEIPKGERHHRVVWLDPDALDSSKPMRFARYHCTCPPMRSDQEY